MEKKKRVAIYCRVSTLDQSNQNQREELIAYAQARGWEIHRIYEEKITGTHTNRPQYKELEKDAGQRRFDCLLVWKLDRIFRSLKDCINGLQEFTDLGVEFCSLKDSGIDMTTPAGRLLLHLLSAFAEFEASIIKMRVRSGIQAAKAKGVRFGRPVTRDDVGIRRLRAQGKSYRQISRELGVAMGSIQRALIGVHKTHAKSGSATH